MSKFSTLPTFGNILECTIFLNFNSGFQTLSRSFSLICTHWCSFLEKLRKKFFTDNRNARPQFVDHNANVNVTIGGEAVLSCNVQDLGADKVSNIPIPKYILIFQFFLFRLHGFESKIQEQQYWQLQIKLLLLIVESQWQNHSEILSPWTIYTFQMSKRMIKGNICAN